jgi:DNA repair exonuclease SbcCD nuclease subunit
MSKIAHLSDLHIDDRAPINRCDEEYIQTIINKLTFVFEYCKKKKINVATIAGDFFDAPNVSWYTVNRIIDLLNKYQKIHLYIVLGQHDLYFRSFDEQKSAIGNLLKHSNVHILTKKGTEIFNRKWSLYGMSFGEVKPYKIKRCRATLVIHHPVGNYNDKHVKPLSTKKVNDMFAGFDVIHSGDYHYTTIKREGKTLIVNPGSLVRKTIAEKDMNHRPCFVIYNIINKKFKKVYIPIRLPKEVFTIRRNEPKSEEMISIPLIVKLKEVKKNKGIVFKRLLLEYCEKNNISVNVIKIFDEVFRTVIEGKKR